MKINVSKNLDPNPDEISSRADAAAPREDEPQPIVDDLDDDDDDDDDDDEDDEFEEDQDEVEDVETDRDDPTGNDPEAG